MTGRFITFEGGEGSGKSTQIRLLAEAFAARGLPHLVTREPGGTTGAESIRKLLVEEGNDWDPTTETVLFMAARVDHVRKRIIPALKRGEHVLCDRFLDSTRVYQGISHGLGLEFIDMLHRFVLGDFLPDLTLLLDIPITDGLARAGARGGAETRFEALDTSFHEAVRGGFLKLAEAEPRRFAVIDARGEADTVHQRIVSAVSHKLGMDL